MESQIIQSISNSGGAVIVAVIFLWYLNKRDALIEKAFNQFADKIDDLARVISKLEKRMENIEIARKVDRKEDRSERR